MTHKELKEQGYRLSQWTQYNVKGRSRRRKNLCTYALYDAKDKFLGVVRPVDGKGYLVRWSAHPVLKSDRNSTRVRAIGEYKTVPAACTALIRWASNEASHPTRRASVTCPTCGATSRKVSSLGGVQTRVCRWGHEFTYDKWMADRLVWAPGAIGSLKQSL